MKKRLLFLTIFIYYSLGFSQLNEKNDITILKKMTLEEINYSLKSLNDLGTYLLGINCESGMWPECTAYVYKNFAGSWQLKQTTTFLTTNGEIEEFSSNENLIYFGFDYSGGSSGGGSYYFNAYSFEDNKFYSLKYSWSDFKYSSYGFSNIESISNKTVLAFLENKASESDYVYKLSDELTLTELWKIDNKNIYEKIFKKETEIIFKYTENSPYDFEEKTAENEDFIIFNRFKGNMYGYNKKTKKYFIIWIPSWFYDTTIFKYLNDDNSICIQDSTLGSNGANIYIDLNLNEVYAIYKLYNED